MKDTKVKITARYHETDKMGIIHHSVYPVWFEIARTELIKKCGCPYSELEKKGLFLPLYRLEADYMRPAYYEDELIISCVIKLLTKTRIVLNYEIYRAAEPDMILCRGSTHHAFSNTDLKPINVQKEFCEIYEALFRLYDEKD